MRFIQSLLLGLSSLTSAHDILKDCGAVSKKSKNVSLQDTQQNAEAFYKCFDLAQKGVNGDRNVLVPEGHIFSSMPFALSNLTDVTFTIDGVLETAPHHDEWPKAEDGRVMQFIQIDDSTNIGINGKGTVEGNGYDWWVREWNHENPHGRPHLLLWNRIQNGEIQGVLWRNSPQFFIKVADVDSIYIHDLEIYVDILKQQDIYENKKEDSEMTKVPSIFKAMLGKYSKLVDLMVGGTAPSLPTFPLNTDGIDPQGSNVTIRNVNITNFDDAIAVKPSNKGLKIAKDGCSQDILVENMNVKFGVGMSLGSVTPGVDHSCIRRVQFRDIKFEYPLKALYVKTNPGTEGTGQITDIMYDNITIHFPVWWNIYVGPQQMKEPSGKGPGCMTYPFGDCETEPLVDIKNITFQNIISRGGILTPGVIRCNETNPCEDINFRNVDMDGWWKQFGMGFITEYAHGNSQATTPFVPLDKTSDRVFELFSLENLIYFVQQSLTFYKVNENDITAWEVLLGIIQWALHMAV